MMMMLREEVVLEVDIYTSLYRKYSHHFCRGSIFDVEEYRRGRQSGDICIPRAPRNWVSDGAALDRMLLYPRNPWAALLTKKCGRCGLTSALLLGRQF